MNWFKKLFCKHKNIEFKNNLYGDSINLSNARSIWTCKKCNKILFYSNLFIKEENAIKEYYNPFNKNV